MPQTQIGNTRGVVAPARSNTVARVVRFTGTASGGNNFQLRVGDNLTANIPRLATATQLRDALRALPQIGVTGVTATGGPLGTSPIDVTYAARVAQFDYPVPTFVNVDLTGGTVTIATQTQPSFEQWNNNGINSVEDIDALLAISGFTQPYIDKLSWNDKLYAFRAISEPWNI